MQESTINKIIWTVAIICMLSLFGHAIEYLFGPITP